MLISSRPVCIAVLLPPALGFCWLLQASQPAPTGKSPDRTLLLNPDAPQLKRKAPDKFQVQLETSKGMILLEIHRAWSPLGVDRFFNLVSAGYYDEARFFRISKGNWVQFGINGDPKIATVWRDKNIPDDPRKESNVRGTIAFAFAVKDGRTTQVFINLKDNAATHDPEPFVPFGKVIDGMAAADKLNAEYGEKAGGGIRAGKQDVLFQKGNAYLQENFPRLDHIVRARVVEGK